MDQQQIESSMPSNQLAAKLSNKITIKLRLFLWKKIKTDKIYTIF